MHQTILELKSGDRFICLGGVCDGWKWTGGLMVKMPTWSMGDRGFESPLVHIFRIFSLWLHLVYPLKEKIRISLSHLMHQIILELKSGDRFLCLGGVCGRQKWTGGLMVKTPTWSMGDRGFESPLVHIFRNFSLWLHQY